MPGRQLAKYLQLFIVFMSDIFLMNVDAFKYIVMGRLLSIIFYNKKFASLSSCIISLNESNRDYFITSDDKDCFVAFLF